jgi:hypothetical protein
MKILLSLFSIATVMVTTLIGANLLLPEAGVADGRELDTTKKAIAKTKSSSDYKIGERLKSNSASSNASSASKDVAGNAPNSKTIFNTTTWEELIPADWNPSADFKNMDLGNFNDADPRAILALKKLRNAWDNAPTNPVLNHKNIKIPGFVVPLDIENGKVTAFLLVPYFGGCLHTPPPPANQIIEVQLEQAHMIKTMEPVWVSGQLEIVRSQTELGTAAYRLNAVKVIPYKEPHRR